MHISLAMKARPRRSSSHPLIWLYHACGGPSDDTNSVGGAFPMLPANASPLHLNPLVRSVELERHLVISASGSAGLQRRPNPQKISSSPGPTRLRPSPSGKPRCRQSHATCRCANRSALPCRCQSRGMAMDQPAGADWREAPERPSPSDPTHSRLYCS